MTNIYTVGIIEAARSVKASGADIEDVLKLGWSPDQIAAHIFKSSKRPVREAAAMSATATIEKPEAIKEKPKKNKVEKASKTAMKALSIFKVGRCDGRAYLFNGAHAIEIGSGQYRDFVSRIVYLQSGTALSETTVREVAQIQRGIALFEGEEVPVGVRVMAVGTSAYLDLCDKKGTIIQIDPEGWRICRTPPVYFFRPPHLKPLPMPAENGNINFLNDLMNFSDDEYLILTRAALLFYLRGRLDERGTFPIIRLCGAAGSAKTTRAKILKYIIDPATPEGRTMPKEPRELFISAKNQYCIVFDNVSRMDHDLQDALCNLASRGGYGRKKNYSDDDETIFEECRPIIIEGITFKVNQDLQSRMLNIDLSPVTENMRKTEREVWGEATEKRPFILGGLLDALSNTLKEIEKGGNIDGYKLPRLADYAEFSLYMERGNGWPEGQTLDAMKENYGIALTTIADDSPLIDTIIKFIMSRETKYFNGTAGEMLKSLNVYVKDNDIEKNKTWPDDPSKLGTFITRNMEVLQNKGIGINKYKTKAGRMTKIWYGEEPSDNTDELPF